MLSFKVKQRTAHGLEIWTAFVLCDGHVIEYTNYLSEQQARTWALKKSIEYTKQTA